MFVIAWLVVISIGPRALAQLIFRPVIPQQLNTRRHPKIFFVSKYNCYYVVAIRLAHQTKHAPVGARSASNLPLLATIYVYLRWRKPIGSTALHFNETQRC